MAICCLHSRFVGADIILVNTNKEGWGGSYEDLGDACQSLRGAFSWAERPAVVMKDIIIHPIQVRRKPRPVCTVWTSTRAILFLVFSLGLGASSFLEKGILSLGFSSSREVEWSAFLLLSRVPSFPSG